VNKAEKDFHLANHKAQAAHAAEMAKCFSKSADCHAELASGSEMSDPAGSKTHSEISKCHGAMAKSCIATGEHHLACCDKLESMAEGSEKVDSGDLQKFLTNLTQLLERGTLPNGLSAIPKHDVPRLIPRPGAPRAEDRDLEAVKSAVAPELREMIFSKDAIG
jgi:hypothetical protein